MLISLPLLGVQVLKYTPENPLKLAPLVIQTLEHLDDGTLLHKLKTAKALSSFACYDPTCYDPTIFEKTERLLKEILKDKDVSVDMKLEIGKIWRSWGSLSKLHTFDALALFDLLIQDPSSTLRHQRLILEEIRKIFEVYDSDRDKTKENILTLQALCCSSFIKKARRAISKAKNGVPDGIRTRVIAVKGRCPGPG